MLGPLAIGRGRKLQLPEATLENLMELQETDGDSPECFESMAEHGVGDELLQGKEQVLENKERDSEIGKVNGGKPKGTEMIGSEIGGEVVDNKVIVSIREEKAVETEKKGKGSCEGAAENCDSGKDGGGGLGKKRGRKPKKKQESLQVQDNECGTVEKSGEKGERLEEGSPGNGQTMTDKGEVEGDGAKHIRRKGKKKGSRTGGKVSGLKQNQNGLVTVEVREELQDIAGKENENDGEKWDKLGGLCLKVKVEMTFTENQEDKETGNEIVGKLDMKNDIFLKQEEEGITSGKGAADLGNQEMVADKGGENGGSIEVNENSYRKRLRTNEKKVSYAENGEEDEEVSVRKKRGRKGRNWSTVTGNDSLEIESVSESGDLAEGNGKKVGQRGRRKHNKEKNDGERESLTSNCGGYSLRNLKVLQQDVKELKINKQSDEVSNLMSF